MQLEARKCRRLGLRSLRRVCKASLYVYVCVYIYNTYYYLCRHMYIGMIRDQQQGSRSAAGFIALWAELLSSSSSVAGNLRQSNCHLLHCCSASVCEATTPPRSGCHGSRWSKPSTAQQHCRLARRLSRSCRLAAS